MPKSGFVNFIYLCLVGIFSLLSVKYLPTAIFNNFAIFSALLGFVATMSTVGTEFYLLRNYNAERISKNKIQWNLTVKLFWVILFCLAVVVYLIYLDYGIYFIIIISLGLFFRVLADSFLTIYRLKDEFSHSVVMLILIDLLPKYLILFVFHDYSDNLVFLFYVLFPFFYTLFVLRKWELTLLSLNIRGSIFFLRNNFSYFYLSLSSFIYSNIDLILAPYFLQDSNLRVYLFFRVLLNFIKSFWQYIVDNSLYPVRRNLEQFEGYFKRLLLFSFLFCLTSLFVYSFIVRGNIFEFSQFLGVKGFENGEFFFKPILVLVLLIFISKPFNLYLTITLSDLLLSRYYQFNILYFIVWIIYLMVMRINFIYFFPVLALGSLIITLYFYYYGKKITDS